MARVRVTQVRGLVRTKPEHRGTMRALGLRRIGAHVEHEDSPQLRGQLYAVAHLVEVQDNG
jgi:large subunit ribosomal protein L30